MATQDSELTRYILSQRRGHFIKVKDMLLKGLVGCLNVLPVRNRFLARIFLLLEVWHIVSGILKYPEPTRENTKEPATHVLFDIWDEFFKYESNIYYSPTRQGRVPLYQAVRRVMVSEVEHDGDYGERITWFLKKLAEKYVSGEWPALPPWAPTNCWNDPVTLKEKRKKIIELAMEG